MSENVAKTANPVTLSIADAARLLTTAGGRPVTAFEPAIDQVEYPD